MILLKKTSFGISRHEKLTKICPLFCFSSFLDGCSKSWKKIFSMLKVNSCIFKNFYYWNLKYFLRYPEISFRTTVLQTTAPITFFPRIINPWTFATRTIILEESPPPLGNYLLGNCTLWNSSHDNYPPNNYPWIVPPGQMPPDNRPPMRFSCESYIMNFCAPNILTRVILPK